MAARGRSPGLPKLQDAQAYLKALGTAKDSNSLRPGERCESEERLSGAGEVQGTGERVLRRVLDSVRGLDW